jgi:coenzyme PQQ precursor peptide PqqA
VWREPGRRAMAHENLELRIMIAAFPGDVSGEEDRWRRPYETGLAIMKWETPEAVDFRFGMEITMYVSNR